MDTAQKPSSTLSKDMKTYFFPLICCNCGTWFPSLGDIKFHFNVCKVSHCYLQCGHCALLFNNWHSFVVHINTKDMVSAKPATNYFSWQNIKKWQNPLKNQHSDILHVAMQNSGLHSIYPQPIVDLSFNLPTDSMLVTNINNVSVQTSPQPHVLPLTDQHSLETPLVSQSNAFFSTHTHVQALLQLNLFIARLLINRQAINRPFSEWECEVIHTTVSQQLWPNTFLSCNTLSELHIAILAWLHMLL